MSDDLVEKIFALTFFAPAVALLAAAFLRKNIGGSDQDNSRPILLEEDKMLDSSPHSKGVKTVFSIGMVVCLLLVGVTTLVTLLCASASSATTGKCPLGF